MLEDWCWRGGAGGWCWSGGAGSRGWWWRGGGVEGGVEARCLAAQDT